MREVFLNELRHLKYGLRQAMLEGTQRYRDQVGDVRIEDEYLRRLQDSGVLRHAGGLRAHSTDVLLKANLSRNPTVTVRVRPDEDADGAS